MAKRLRLWRCFLPFMIATSGAAQQPVVTVRGVVRDTTGKPLPGVDILLGQRLTSTDVQGAFRVDSLRPGQYVIVIRRIGYSPIRTRLRVGAVESPVIEYSLAPAPFLLPALVTEGRRTSIYGTVADSSYRAAVGATVQVIGFQGGEATTDSGGRFAFPRADHGAYMVRVTFPGYRERRLTLELERGEGRQLALRLTPGFESGSRAEYGALKDLRVRLATGFRRERLTASELVRFGSGLLCDQVPMNTGANPVIIVNGTEIYRGMPRSFLCFWQANDVELVEFGPDICREASGTLAFLLNVWCLGGTRSVPRSLRGGGRRIPAHAAAGG